MFFVKNLEHVITLHPSFFGPRVKDILKARLHQDVEGTCTGQYYIVMVLQLYGISEGKIIPGSGIAEYTIDYQAAVWRPFKGEVMDCVVDKVNVQGVTAEAGPHTVFVSRRVLSLLRQGVVLKN